MSQLFFQFSGLGCDILSQKNCHREIKRGFSPFFAVTCHLSQCHKKIKGYPYVIHHIVLESNKSVKVRCSDERLGKKCQLAGIMQMMLKK